MSYMNAEISYKHSFIYQYFFEGNKGSERHALQTINSKILLKFFENRTIQAHL
jgi:hypothetical protein